MKNKNIIYGILLSALIFLSAVGIGFYSVKYSENTISPTEIPLPNITSSETIPLPPPSAVPEIYKISLTGNTLSLICNNTTIAIAEITPEVYPYADIKALNEGIEYSSYEDVMSDWESLSS